MLCLLNTEAAPEGKWSVPSFVILFNFNAYRWNQTISSYIHLQQYRRVFKTQPGGKLFSVSQLTIKVLLVVGGQLP